MIRTSILALASIVAMALAWPASAQGPRIDQAPPAPGGAQPGAGPAPTDVPGPTAEIIGPEGSFRLQPDGVTWERFQSVRAIGVRCTDKACGGERVFCLIQVRSVAGAQAGAPTPGDSAAEFGAGVLRTAPKELNAEYSAPFEEKKFGPNLGQWAEVKAEGEPGKLRFGLFLTSAEKRHVAFNCVSPSAKWDENKPKFEGLLASLQITK
ncbi:hypothetical protein [Methylopila sp. M107]|uniref:hypothetical protein n=1 Tax=Methylopila sp. M107 TaxID=1101190 RepID=UPI000371539D|nr:hypothetical protein [Methylopila sp. M107]